MILSVLDSFLLNIFSLSFTHETKSSDTGEKNTQETEMILSPAPQLVHRFDKWGFEELLALFPVWVMTTCHCDNAAVSMSDIQLI